MATSPNFSWPEPDNTDLVKNGALAIRTAVDAIDSSMADLKGGTTGQVLTKASGTDMDFTWGTASGGSNQFYAGKNKVINGDFSVNQRSFTSTSTSTAFGFDRWQLSAGTGTFTYSAQAFTPGTAPVAGYEGTNFARLVTSGQTSTSGYASIQNKIEGVRTFAGQTATLSFWAKASSGTPKVQPTLEQVFGTGGSASVPTAGTAQTISTSWARYSVTISVPSVSGKTIGANNALAVELFTSLGTDFPTYGNIGVQAATIDIWGVQLEAGSSVTSFETASASIGGELALCQRYYFRYTTATAYGNLAPVAGIGSSTTVAKFSFAPPVPMRINPTSLDYSTLILYDTSNTPAVTSAAISSESTANLIGINFTVASGLTQFRPYQILSSNSTAAYLGASAEL